MWLQKLISWTHSEIFSQKKNQKTIVIPGYQYDLSAKSQDFTLKQETPDLPNKTSIKHIYNNSTFFFNLIFGNV